MALWHWQNRDAHHHRRRLAVLCMGNASCVDTNAATYLRMMAGLATDGVMYDRPGMGRAAGNPSLHHFVHELPTQLLHALQTNNMLTPTTSVVVVGHSLGGCTAVALAAALGNPTMLMLASVPAELASVNHGVPPMLARPALALLPNASPRNGLARVSPATRVHVFHSTQDELVPWAHALQIESAARQRGCPCRRHDVRGSHHDVQLLFEAVHATLAAEWGPT